MKKLLLSLGIGLLSCISFSSAISFEVSNYYTVNNYNFYQFSPFTDLQTNSISDGFMCFEIGGKFNNFAITDNNWNNIVYFNGQEIENSFSPLCFFLSDFSQGYNLMIQSNYQLTVNYFYMYALQTPPTQPVSCYTGVMNIRLVNGNNNSQNDLYYEFSPYAQNQARYTIYYTGVQATAMQNGVLFEGNDCSSIQSDLNTCSTNFQSCQGYLNSCQSDYSSCSSSLGNCGSSLNSCQSALGNCMQGNIGTGENNWSAIYINDIQHLGKPIINITIPDEISWDYESTGSLFDLTVDGYNVDSEYIEGVINKQNYIPTTEDLTEVFSNLGTFGGLLVVCLFVILVFYMFKKIFS